jgi:PAS domain S-box-containing protein
MTTDEFKSSSAECASDLNKDDLRDGESLFLSLVHSIPACFVRKDRDGKIVFVNERFAALMATSADEMIGKTVGDFYSEQFAKESREEDVSVMQSGEVIEDVFDDVVDGEVRYFASRKGPVWNERREVIGIQTIFWDITEQRIAEDALKAEREELRLAKDAADEANRAKSDFLANMSHEIRTPMNAIIGITDLLMETQLTQTQQEYLRMVQDSGESLLTLINDVLDFSKIESGKFELDDAIFDLRETLGDTMKGLGFRAHDKSIELVFQVDEEIPKYLRGDPGRLRQIVVNLVGNAIKFTEVGEVLLAVGCKSKTEEEVVMHVSVIDTGIGINKENCEKVFQEFEQADSSTTRNFGGTGLGLAICSRLIELMKGRIWVESELGKGSNFQFEIPLQVDESMSVLKRTEMLVSLQDVRVLVVDDNATNRRILKDMLTNWGMKPSTSSSAASGMQAIIDADDETDPFEIVISDVNMPEKDGVTFVQEVVRELQKNPTQMIMLTSGSRPVDSKTLQALGVKSRIIKPVKQSEIYSAIVKSLGSEFSAVDSFSSHQRASGLDEYSNSVRELNILLAEDNVVNQKLAVGILQKLGHQTTIANNGREALDLLGESHGFDLVLMDVQMPKMDGLQATQEMRKKELETKEHIPIVAMTAHAMKGDRENCLAHGMDDYLCKPIRLKDMADKLVEMFPASSSNPAGEVTRSLASPNSDIICWSEALTNVAGDKSLLLDLVQVFLDETPELMESAVSAATKEDMSALKATAHSLKGSMLFLNPVDALKSARDVEQFADEGNLEAVQSSIKELKPRYETLLVTLKSYLDQA